MLNVYLKQVCEDFGVTPIYAAESGSRAWGFHSTDSDYDVRFLYVYPKDRYLSLEGYDTNIPNQFKENRLYDFNGLELRHALVLLSKSNPAITEWLKSPVYYIDKDGIREKLNKIVSEQFRPKALGYHYRNMMANVDGNKVSIFPQSASGKSYLYSLRCYFNLLFMRHNPWIVPPVPFSAVMNHAIKNGHISAPLRQDITNLHEEKMAGKELDVHKYPFISNFLTHAFPEAENIVKELPERNEMPLAPLAEIFRSYL